MIGNDDYLWDRSGPPDREVAALERLLAPLAHDGRAFRGAAHAGLGRWGGLAALAAGLLLAVGVWRDLGGAGGGAADDLPLRVEGRAQPLRPGAWFVATEGARRLELGEVGWLTLAVGSRLHVRRLAEEETKLYLARGEMEALVSIDARPRFFQVGTPATTCVDLGCRYTLTVDDAGDAFVEVHTGRVAFENEGQEVFVPAGATCRARRASGHGTPRYGDAAPELARALDEFDAARRAPDLRRRALAGAVLARVDTVRDALVAWHFLQDRDAAIAAAAHARLHQVAEPPPGLIPAPDEPVTAAVREAWKEYLEPMWW